MPMTLDLQNMRHQTDEAFPARDKTSDGGKGDTIHQTRVSGHNPDDTPGSKPAWDGDPDNLPEWRAWDMDADLRTPGVTTQAYVDHVRRLPGVSAVIRYMIYAGMIYHVRTGFTAERYDGADQHHEHVHVEGAWSQAGDNNSTFDFRFEELTDMAIDYDKIRAIVREEAVKAVDARVGDVSPRWSDTGGPVAKDDPNPTVTPASSLFYVGATARRVENNTREILKLLEATPPTKA